MIMDMTSATETRWYDSSPRLGGSPNAGTSHQSAGGTSSGSANNGIDPSDMGAFYPLENSGHRRYYPTGYGPHGMSEMHNLLIHKINLILILSSPILTGILKPTQRWNFFILHSPQFHFYGSKFVSCDSQLFFDDRHPATQNKNF